MVQTQYFGALEIKLWEYLALVVMMVLIWIVSIRIKNKNIITNPVYKYYIPGLTVKLFAGVIFCLIYIYYYGGGDTTSYYESGCALVNLFYRNPADFFTVLFGSNSWENLFKFDNGTGYPLRFMYFDNQTYTVIRLITPILLVTGKSYLLGTVLLSWLSYFGIWKLYLLYTNHFKPIAKQLAYGILFLPSVVFWGSGILKDTITLSSACWFVYAIYNVFILKKHVVGYVFVMVVAATLVVLIKPYIFITLLPGAILWIIYDKISKIKNRTLLLIYLPVIYTVAVVGGFVILSQLGSMMSKFSLDKVLTTASVTQKDLKSDAYGTNRFDIGDFDPTVGGVLSKVPIAMTAGLFRPFIWECSNIVMVLSGLENLAILGITVAIGIRIRFRRLLKIMFSNPLLFFSVSYSLLFSFAVGLTTSNFGALVRFKIPFLPFYISSLFILGYFIRNKKQTTMAA